VELIFLILTIIAIIVAIVFGFLQVVVPFVKGEVTFTKRYPFVISVREQSQAARRRKKLKQKKSIVILPLENLGKPEDEYFASGIAEEITSRLALVSGLAVISRTSASQYAHAEKAIDQIGEELGVEYALEGSVRWARTPEGSDRVRVTSQLIRTADDTHLWADTYDRVLDDIFDIQSEIAQQVVMQLGAKILAREREALEKKPTDNIEAYHAYLQARYYATRPHFSLDNWQRVIDYAERAVACDPHFTEAYIELAKAHSKFYFFWYDYTEERKARAKRAINRAADLSPDSPHVHLATGLYYLWVFRDPEKALHEFERAEKGLPSSGAVIEAKAAVFELQGRWDDVIDAYDQAFMLSPRDASLAMARAHAQWVTRHYEDAIEACDQAIALAPDDAWGYLYKAFIYWCWNGDTKRARAAIASIPCEHVWIPWALYWTDLYERKYEDAIERLDAVSGDWIRIKICARPLVLLRGFAYELMNESEQAREQYESARKMLEQEIKKVPDDPRYHGSLGITYANLGLKEQAVEHGKQAVKLLPVSKDAFYGVPYVLDLAFIYTIIGEHDKALQQLEYLLSMPSWCSVPYYEMDPRWDRLRDNPKFQEMMKKYVVTHA
jgi:TolB-like protein/Flp pilus assembly protein TadD